MLLNNVEIIIKQHKIFDIVPTFRRIHPIDMFNWMFDFPIWAIYTRVSILFSSLHLPFQITLVPTQYILSINRPLLPISTGTLFHRRVALDTQIELIDHVSNQKKKRLKEKGSFSYYNMQLSNDRSFDVAELCAWLLSQ